MSQPMIEQRSSDSAQELGDETFMSATELRNYMVETVMAKALKDPGSDQAEKAREELIKSLLQPVPVTPEKIAEEFLDDCRRKDALPSPASQTSYPHIEEHSCCA